MRARTLTDAAAAPAALTAFLRGVERRGAVFAQLQCGDANRGDDALGVAMRTFRGMAADVPVAHWPQRFWAALLGAPPLREPVAAPGWLPVFAPLADLGHGPRAALLLRLVAGLAEVDAAGVLGIARPTYRLALQRALPRHPDGTPDQDSWQALGEAAQQAIRHMPADRLVHLAQVREAAIQGRRIGPRSTASAATDAASPPRWWMPAMAGSAALVLIALTLTFVFPVGEDGPAGDVRIRVRPLPPADDPAATYDAATALLTHRDFQLLQAETAPASAAARDPAFHAWLWAQTRADSGADEAEALPLVDAMAMSPLAVPPEPADAL